MTCIGHGDSYSNAGNRVESARESVAHHSNRIKYHFDKGNAADSSSYYGRIVQAYNDFWLNYHSRRVAPHVKIIRKNTR